jgi:hypothetical protein
VSLINSNQALLLILTSGVAAVMVRLGIRTKLLERHRHGRCRACGRALDAGRCPHCV